MRDLVHPLRNFTRVAAPPLFTWNVRHLRSTRTPNNHEKRNVLFKATTRDRAGLIQETHWTAQDARVWASLLQGRHVFAAPGRPTSGHGIAGGVAIILSSHYTELQATILVPSCAIMVQGKLRGEAIRFISVYLPPDEREETLAALRESLPPLDDVPTYWGGDVNMQVLAPRDGELELASQWNEMQVARRQGIVPMDGPTYVRRDHESQIDTLAAPLLQAAQYTVRKTWRLSLSDHAMIFADVTGQGAGRRPDVLTPWAFKGLPATAIQDLRRRYLALELRFGIPRVDLTALPQPLDWIRPARPGEPPGDDDVEIAQDADLDDAPASDDGNPAAPVPLQLDPVRPPPLLPALLLYGRSALTAMIQSWWGYWRRQTARTAPSAILRRAVQTGASIRPTGPLDSWMRALGWTGDVISPSEAGRWLLRWKADQDQRAAARLTPWQRGPGAERAPLEAHYTIARELFRQTQALLGVRDTQGAWHEKPSDIERILWESRAEIWGTAPSLPIYARRVLDFYFRHGPHVLLPQHPLPDWRRIATLVLSPSGSAPGVDGEPYEVYHPGARFVSCLLAQGMFAAEMGDEYLATVLGLSVDLLVWIHKTPGAETPNDLRPLQLPTCFRRLYGAVVADIVGPVMEPQLSPDQAAVRGGQCGPNITAANQHLADGTPQEPPPGPAWRAILGDDHDIVERHIDEIADSLPPCPSTATCFADQNKAFERVAMQWTAMVLARWGFPLWLLRSLLGLCQRRAVRFIRGAFLGPLRQLLRSVGMGGTASPLLWCLSYDPIIAAVASVAGAPCPTYVDDLAALLSGARQTLRVAFLLPWISRSVGLLIATHTCRRLWIHRHSPALQVALEQIPVEWERHGHGTLVSGLTPELVRKLLCRRLGNRVGATEVVTRPCNCSLKTALVPASHKSWWSALMAHTPFGASAVRSQWPYLGAMCTICSEQEPPANRRMTADCFEMMRTGTWGKAMLKLRTRSAALHSTHASPGRRAAIWNAYMASLVPYPAHIVAPDRRLEDALKAQFRVALGLARARWVPHYVLAGLGLLFQVPGCPRCPAAYASAVAAAAAHRQDVWGPPHARSLAQRRLRAALRWVDAPDPQLPPPRPRGKVLTLIKARAVLRRRNERPLPARGPILGRHLYGAMWGQHYCRLTMEWFSTRSGARPWAPGAGGEWHILRHARTYTAAHHVTRFLAGGLVGHARWREPDDHIPHECSACHGRARQLWTSAGRTHDGVAWCDRCMGPWAHAPDRWAMLPDEMLPPTLRDRAASARHNRPQLTGHRGFPQSGYGACPLCGHGEAGSEHLWTWCPAVALAWDKVAPPGSPPTMGQAIMDQEHHSDLLCHFVHQVVYRHTIGVGLPPLEAQDGALAIVAGLTVSQEDSPDPQTEDGLLYRASDVDGVWERMHTPCGTCAPQLPDPRRVQGSATPAQARTGGRGGDAMRRTLVCTHAEAAHASLMMLTGEQQRGGWLLAGPGWAPMPRCDAAQANAEWSTFFCVGCSRHRATLVASTALAPYDEIIVSSSPFPDQDKHCWPLEVTFDGGARAFLEAPKVGGAGASLWHHPPDGSAPTLLASCVVAMPSVDNAQVAEASGARAALALLAACRSYGYAARVVGDNLAVVRYGAGASRFRRLLIQAQVEQGLVPLAASGWTLTWQAVRRRLNKVADRLATIGVFWAEALRRSGVLTTRTHIVWHDTVPPVCPPAFPDVRAVSLRVTEVEEAADRLEDLARERRRTGM